MAYCHINNPFSPPNTHFCLSIFTLQQSRYQALHLSPLEILSTRFRTSSSFRTPFSSSFRIPSSSSSKRLFLRASESLLLRVQNAFFFELQNPFFVEFRTLPSSSFRSSSSSSFRAPFFLELQNPFFFCKTRDPFLFNSQNLSSSTHKTPSLPANEINQRRKYSENSENDLRGVKSNANFGRGANRTAILC